MSERLWEPYPGDEPGPHTVVGTVLVLREVECASLGNHRDLYVYLPPSYPRGDRRYPVIYMHDGQNLFDQAISFGAEWEVDQTLEAAAAEGLECIVVGIANTGESRLDEYSPWLDSKHEQGGRGDEYVAWITDTIKPMIDADFRTRTERDATGIAGSSMGGLISLYAFFSRPEVFGFVGAMSPALWFAGRRVFGFVEAIGTPPSGRVYLDAGTGEGREVLVDLRRMRDLLARLGYRPGRELLCVVETGARHEEKAWARRLRRELQFLLNIPVARATP